MLLQNELDHTIKRAGGFAAGFGGLSASAGAAELTVAPSPGESAGGFFA